MWQVSILLIASLTDLDVVLVLNHKKFWKRDSWLLFRLHLFSIRIISILFSYHGFTCLNCSGKLKMLLKLSKNVWGAKAQIVNCLLLWWAWTAPFSVFFFFFCMVFWNLFVEFWSVIVSLLGTYGYEIDLNLSTYPAALTFTAYLTIQLAFDFCSYWRCWWIILENLFTDRWLIMGSSHN